MWLRRGSDLNFFRRQPSPQVRNLFRGFTEISVPRVDRGSRLSLNRLLGAAHVVACGRVVTIITVRAFPACPKSAVPAGSSREQIMAAAEEGKRCAETCPVAAAEGGSRVIYPEASAQPVPPARWSRNAGTLLHPPPVAAEKLGVTIEQLLGFVRDGELRYVNIGRLLYRSTFNDANLFKVEKLLRFHGRRLSHHTPSKYPGTDPFTSSTNQSCHNQLPCI